MSELTEAVKELQEAAIVMSGIQSRQAVLLKEHSEWLVSHEKAMTEIREVWPPHRRTHRKTSGGGEAHGRANRKARKRHR